MKKPKSRKTEHSEAMSLKLGQRLVTLRNNRDWTQKELSSRAGLDQGFISRIEAGKIEPCLGSLATLASAFGISLSDMFKGIS